MAYHLRDSDYNYQKKTVSKSFKEKNNAPYLYNQNYSFSNQRVSKYNNNHRSFHQDATTSIPPPVRLENPLVS